MDFEKIYPLLVPALITIFSWFILYRLNKAKDREAKRKELIINYLISSWEKLEYASHRKDYDPTEFVEKPIANIQMFGTVEQIQLAQKFADDFATNKEASLTKLLVSLRSHLRKELKLEGAPKTIKHLRLDRKNIKLHDGDVCPSCGR